MEVSSKMQNVVTGCCMQTHWNSRNSYGNLMNLSMQTFVDAIHKNLALCERIWYNINLADWCCWKKQT